MLHKSSTADLAPFAPLSPRCVGHRRPYSTPRGFQRWMSPFGRPARAQKLKSIYATGSIVIWSSKAQLCMIYRVQSHLEVDKWIQPYRSWKFRHTIVEIRRLKIIALFPINQDIVQNLQRLGLPEKWFYFTVLPPFLPRWSTVFEIFEPESASWARSTWQKNIVESRLNFDLLKFDIGFEYLPFQQMSRL